MRSKLWLSGWMITAAMLTGCAGQNKDAADEAEKAAARDPFETQKDPPINSNTHYAAGQLAEIKHDYPTAIDQYNRTLKQEPKHVKAMYRLGVIHTNLKEWDEGIEAWKKYVEATNKSAEAYANLGLTYMLSGQLDSAEGAFRKGIERDPKCETCRVNYGLMLARMGRTGEATQQLSAVLKPAEVHYNLGSIYQQIRRNEAARDEYEKALQLDPNFKDAKRRLAELK